MPDINSDFVEDFPAGSGKTQVILRDDHLRGFGLRVTANGCKAFIVEGRVNGVVRRITLGKVDELTAESAREQAAKILAEMAAGTDPRPPKAPSLLEVMENYVTSKRLRANTIKNQRHAGSKYFSDWLQLPVDRITEAMIIQRHAALGEQYSPTTVNLAFSMLRSVLFHAVSAPIKKRANMAIRNAQKWRADFAAQSVWS